MTLLDVDGETPPYTIYALRFRRLKAIYRQYFIRITVVWVPNYLVIGDLVFLNLKVKAFIRNAAYNDSGWIYCAGQPDRLPLFIQR